jgi:hypothetical protein
LLGAIRFVIAPRLSHIKNDGRPPLFFERMSKNIAFGFALSALVGCGASAPIASSPESSGRAVKEPAEVAPLAHSSESVAVEEPAPQDVAQEKEPAALEIPTECAPSAAKICTPPTPFVAKLCQSKSADLALAMFRKSTPWTRAYLRRDMDAWYTGVRLSSPVQLVHDEEVIVVASRSGGSSGIQVSGSGSYDVYRWDGKCVSVMADEVSLRRPRVPESAPIVWKSLSDATHEALLDDRGIKLRHDLQRDRCSKDSVAPRCTEATAALVRVIADYVRKDGKLADTRLTAR